MAAVFRKELSSFFNSMLGYVFVGAYVLIMGIIFFYINIRQQYPDFSATLNSSTFLFLIVIPVVSMRLFAEEARQKTDQLLFTAPISIIKIAAAKYLAALALYLIPLIVMIIFPLAMAPFTTGMPVGVVLSTFLGYFLLGACLISVGLLISSLTENQIVAALATCAAVIIFFLLDMIANNAPADRTSNLIFIAVLIIAIAAFIRLAMGTMPGAVICGVIALIACAAAFFINNTVFDGSMGKVLSWISLMSRYTNFGKGTLNITDIVYGVSFSTAFVFFTSIAVERRRWR